MAMATQAPAKSRWRITSDGTSASAPLRRCTSAKSAKAATAASARPITRASPQPHSGPWSSARRKASSPAASSAIPVPSRPASVRAGRSRGTRRETTAIANSAIGTLSTNTQRQLARSVSSPPSIGPSALARPATPTTNAPAFPAPSGPKAAKVIDRHAGQISAPPTAISARATISTGADQASAATHDRTRKIAAPTRKQRSAPNMSHSRPPGTISIANTSEYALRTHWAVDRLVSNSRSIAGIVTLSAVKSFATAMMLSAKATSAIAGGPLVCARSATARH